MKTEKRIRIAAMILLCMLLTTGCWDKIEIENRLFVLGIGVDTVKEEGGKISKDKYTLSFVAPKVREAMEGSGPAFSIYKTVDTSVIMSLSQLLERFSQKQFFGHTRAVIFGEDIMKNEKLLKEVIDGLSRYHELHNSMYVYIVPSRAEDVFKVEPEYENLLAPYITGITDNSEYTSKIMKMSLTDMIIMLTNHKGGLVIPELIPDKKEVKVTGAGVLRDYKLIGYLGDQETAVYNWLTDKAKGGIITINHKDVVLAFRHFTFKRDIKLSKVEGGKIYLDYNMKTEGSIEEYILGEKILESAFLQEINKEVEKRIESESEKLIKKFQQEFRIDLIGAEDYLSKRQPKLYKTIEKGYDKFFTDNIIINVKAEVDIRRVGLSQ